jgi:hypothetical protein
MCTEYMARPRGRLSSPFARSEKYNVGMINWGLCEGKSQTIYLDSWERPYVEYEPWIWFHDVFRTDGTPYLREETELIKRITGKRKRRRGAR